MDEQPKVYAGRLGWSNMRAGVEFYTDLPDGNGRHEREHSDSLGRDPGWGHLLIDDIDPRMTAEGQHVVVVVLPDRHPDPSVIDRVRTALKDTTDG